MSVMLGRHLLVDLCDCDRMLLDDEGFLLSRCVAAAKIMGATVVGEQSHRFDPIGVSVVVILAESHLSLHTWPEYGMASIDIFTCGVDAEPHLAKDFLAECLQAEQIVELDVERGQMGRFGGKRSQIATLAETEQA